MKNKKILILVNHDLVIFNFRKELVKELIEQGYEIFISSPDGKRIPELISYGCQFIEVKNIDRHGKNPFKDLLLLKEYNELIREINPLCILTYTIKPNIFGAIAAKKNDIPCFANITGLGSAVEKKSIIQFLTVGLYKYSFKNIQMVFFQNKENQAFFQSKKIVGNNIKLLPGSGVNLKEYSYYEYPEEKKIKFVFISRIMKEKGIDLYLKAADVLMKKYNNLEFHVCGFCEEEYELILDEKDSEGVIIYHGMVDNISDIIKNMHCTVHPTYYPEGLSNVLLESSACGRPIITTKRSGCKEVVNQGKNGFLINENDEDSLIEALELFIALPYVEKEQMGIEGRRFVEEKFNRDIVVAEYIKEINTI